MNKRNVNLDLLRALAISLVFMAHTVLSFGAPEALAPLQLGGVGVDLFFVLSGWLIGTQLFKELDKFGNIHIRRFWIRRWMRTLPAYYAVLVFTIVQQYFTKEAFNFPFAYLVFLQNYSENMPIFTVSWSLSVEEQFYLVVAPAIALLTKVGRYARTFVLVSLLLLPSLFRYLGMYDSLYETHVRLDCCIMGVLLANIFHNHKLFWERLDRFAASITIISIVLFLLFFLNRWFPIPGVNDPSPLFLSFIFGSWVVCATKSALYENERVEKLVYYISSRSYAIYLLHPDALAITARLVSKEYFFVYIICAAILAGLAAEVLYRTIEIYFMNMRGKFELSKSRGSMP